MNKENQLLDLNVIVVGGSQDGRNQVASLIAEALSAFSFEDVRLETTGPVQSHGSKSVLDVMQETSPHLFTEPVHVTAGGALSAFVTESDGAITDTSRPNMIMTFIATEQPVTPDELLDKVESESLLASGNREDRAPWCAEKPEQEPAEE